MNKYYVGFYVAFYVIVIPILVAVSLSWVWLVVKVAKWAWGG